MLTGVCAVRSCKVQMAVWNCLQTNLEVNLEFHISSPAFPTISLITIQTITFFQCSSSKVAYIFHIVFSSWRFCFVCSLCYLFLICQFILFTLFLLTCELFMINEFYIRWYTLYFILLNLSLALVLFSRLSCINFVFLLSILFLFLCKKRRSQKQS